MADDRAPKRKAEAAAEEPDAPAGTCTPTRDEEARPAAAEDAAAMDTADSRPTDADIISWENAIRAEQTEKQQLIGDVEPLSALEAEYAAGSEVFVAKIKRLAQTYRAVRRTAGDGNCFFRSFLFAYMESLVESNDLHERNRVVTCIRQWKPHLVEAGYQELVFEDAMEVLIDQLNSLGTPEPLSVGSLETNLRDATISPMMVMYLRMLTAAEIQRRQDFFLPFILTAFRSKPSLLKVYQGMSDDAPSAEQFCRRYVEPMGEESDHVHIVALIAALQVPVRVVYLDRSTGPLGAGGRDLGDVNSHDFRPEGEGEPQGDPQQGQPGAAGGGVVSAEGGAAAHPRVTLLYRPGHYDILYPLQG